MSTSRWGTGNGIAEPQKFQMADLAVVAVNWISGVLSATSNSVATLEIVLRQHANAMRDEAEFVGSIEMGLESLDTGGDS